MSRIRRFRADVLALITIILLALLWFAPVLAPPLTHASLLPYDNLYGFEPWRTLQPALTPHNELLSDLVLENAVWKQHIRESLAAGQLPLWNPKILTGQPFLAAGQASTFYPLNLLFYLLPPEWAYGWFTALQVALAGINMFLFARVLHMRSLAALFSGVVYMFSGFLVVSVVFTMFVAAVPWLPLLLAVIEFIIQKQEEKGARSFHPIPYITAGAVIIGLIVLAGHPELIYYTLLVAGTYTLARLIVAFRTMARSEAPGAAQGPAGEAAPSAQTSEARNRLSALASRLSKLAAWLLVMTLLGIALGAVQLVPLAELLPLNFRVGSASLQQVREWAWPSRQILTFALPNVFGSPSHHQWFDIWAREWVPSSINALGEQSRTIFWGVKNYVEGGNYLGIATWVLATIAVWQAAAGGLRRKKNPTAPPPDSPLHNSQFTIHNSLREAGWSESQEREPELHNSQFTIHNSLPLPAPSTPGTLPPSPCFRSCLPLARRSTPFSIMACPDGINYTARSAGSFPSR